MFRKLTCLSISMIPLFGIAQSVLTLYTDCSELIDLEVGESPSLYKIEACGSVYTIFYQEDSMKIQLITWEGVKTPEQVDKEITSGKVTGNQKVILKDSLTKLGENPGKIKNPLI
ncbi:hypothetical protein HXK64_01600 [Candidatus Gracilibacteria bacterium]|nr:hypothetical protein [Candidatus Gracilibacteria bacterium]